MKKINLNLQKITSPAFEYFARLNKKDQFALGFLGVFLVLFVFGYGGWELHQKANNSQKIFSDTNNDLLWLRSQAGNINPNQTQAQNTADGLNQMLTQSGVTAQISENGENIQLNFSHSQASVVNNIFNQISQQGFTIKQLQINQVSPDRLEIQSVLSH